MQQLKILGTAIILLGAIFLFVALWYVFLALAALAAVYFIAKTYTLTKGALDAS